MVGIVGAKGCGKSTLVSIITNNILIGSGEVFVDCENILDKSFDVSKFFVCTLGRYFV